MRYVIQIACMLTDLAILAAMIATVIYGFTGNMVIIDLVLILLAWSTWQDVGGPFFAWRPSNIRKFMANAKKQGL